MTYRPIFFLALAAFLTGCQTNHPGTPTLTQIQASMDRDKALRAQLTTQCTPEPFSAETSSKEWTSASRPGDGSVFAFRGNVIGDPIAKLFPCHARSEIPELLNVNKCVRDTKIASVRVCTDHATKRIGDIVVTEAIYNYRDERLGSFTLTFYQDQISELRRLLIAKYGKPSNTVTGTVQNRVGAKFDSTSDTWNTPDGTLLLQSRAGTVDKGILAFINPEFEQFKKDQAEADAKRKAGSSL